MFAKRAHKRASSSSTNATVGPVSPLHSPTLMNFDFELPRSADNDVPPSPFKSAFSPVSEGSISRPKTSHGAGSEGKKPAGLQLLPHIPRVSSRPSMRSSNSDEGQQQQQDNGVVRRARERDDSDNFSVMSKKSALKARLSFEHPVEPLPSRPTTPGGSTIEMSSSLFPARRASPVSAVSPTTMTREFIDSRDKPYSQGPQRPFLMHQNHSSPNLAYTSARQPTPIYSSSQVWNSPQASMQNLSTRTTYSGTTARPSTQASSSYTAHSGLPVVTIGTPYQATADSFPLPQHVRTRPKTPGAIATVAGVSVPTHHTSTSKMYDKQPDHPKKKGLLRNPLALLQRRRSNQDPELVVEERAQRQAQAQALARQKDVVASGVNKPPPDFDPRIKGRVVHDFSAPRGKRNTFDEADMQLPFNGGSNTSGASSSSHHEYPPRNASLVNRGGRPDPDQRRSNHTPMFVEHLSENPEASRRISSIQAEKLENREFLQRASKHSSVTTYSQESAVLPPFARRSQTLDPMQASLYQDDDSKHSSDPSSDKERDSTLSSISEVSPITGRNSNFPADVRASLSPVSPSSPGKAFRPLSEGSKSPSQPRPVSEVSKPSSQDGSTLPVSQVSKTSSQEKHRKSASEATARPYSVILAPPAINTIAEGSNESSPIEPSSSRTPQEPQLLTRGISFRHSGSPSPAIEPLLPPTMMKPESSTDSPATQSLLDKTAGVSTPERTPEPDLVESIQFKPNKDQPKLVEKRASAVGHTRKSSKGSSVPKHHASNASRFSFQFGNESAAQEQALEEKHRKMRSREIAASTPRGRSPSDDDEEDYFDEDAMDDMDEMELQATQEPQPGAQLAPGLPSQSSLYLQQAREALHQHDSDDGSVYDDDDIPNITNEEDIPYADHPAFRTHSALGDYSRHNSFLPGTQDGYWRGSTIDHYMRDSYFAPGAASRIQSHASGFEFDFNEHHDHALNTDGSAATQRFSRPRSNFYMQPNAAMQSGVESPKDEKPPIPPRDSGNSERNRVASGIAFEPSQRPRSPDQVKQHIESPVNPEGAHASSDLGFVNASEATQYRPNVGVDTESTSLGKVTDSTSGERISSSVQMDSPSSRSQLPRTDMEGYHDQESDRKGDSENTSLASSTTAGRRERYHSDDDIGPASLSKSTPRHANNQSTDAISLASPPRSMYNHNAVDSADAISLASPPRSPFVRQQSGAGMNSDGHATTSGSPHATNSSLANEKPGQLDHQQKMGPMTPPPSGTRSVVSEPLDPSSKASSPRTVSTGLGLSMFTGFEFDERPPPLPTGTIVNVDSPKVSTDAEAQDVDGVFTPSGHPTADGLKNPDQLASPTSVGSSPRTVSTALGMSMFGGFEFDDQPGPLPAATNRTYNRNTNSTTSDIGPRTSGFNHSRFASVQQPAPITQAEHQRFLSLNNNNNGTARSVSTALGMSSFGGFELDEGQDNVYNSRPETTLPPDAATRHSGHQPSNSQAMPCADWSELHKHTATVLGSSTNRTAAFRVSSPSDRSQSTPHESASVSGFTHIRESMNPNLQYARPSIAYPGNDEEDDLYFDDGNFERDINESHTGSIDENVFDDPSFLARPGMAKAVNHRRDNTAMSIASLSSDGPYPFFARPSSGISSQRLSQYMLEDLPLQAPVDPRYIPQRNPSEDMKRLGMSDRVPPVPVPESNREAFSQMQSNLQSYHAALAEAANKAAADGRFLRTPSVSTARSVSHSSRLSNPQDDIRVNDDSSVYSNGEEDGALAVPNTNGGGTLDFGRSDTTLSHLTHLTTYSPLKTDFDFGFDTSPGNDDDAFGNDDDLVAAANAEALASDDEGFYGQEFDFYGRPRANSGDLEAVNGGFFGEDGDNGLTRNKSLKEPNLTPITERSEFSTRNSFIGLGLPGQFGVASAGPFGPHSPALARMPVSPLFETEVTSFDELRKLKANAFGDSSSLRTNSNRSSSQSLQAAWSPVTNNRSSGGPNHFGGTHMQLGYSTDSSGSSNPNISQPAYTHSFQESPHSAGSSGGMLFPNDVDATPKKNTQTAEPMTARKIPPSPHSRKGSGADSVTYVREPDPENNGKPRWVLERRRTSEQGQLELIGRELVQGGWI